MNKYLVSFFLVLAFPLALLSSNELETRTKIVCTIGPATNTPEMLGALIDTGMNVSRLNFSHGSHEEYIELIKKIKDVRKAKEKPLAILLDTKGPEIRVGQLHDNKMMLEKDAEYWLVPNETAATADQIPINPSSIIGDLKNGATVLFDDGAISSTIVAVEPGKRIKIKVNAVEF